jgi:putative AlgH/UPF0301 family transcriptional regulator
MVSALPGPAAQEKTPQKQNDEGVFLVARRELGDPLFAKSTVLMLPMKDLQEIFALKDQDVVMGLIINKPIKVSLHDLFPHAEGVKNGEATAYFGGPVDVHDQSAVFRSATAPKNAIHVFADVYVTFDSDAISELLKDPAEGSTVRVFLGRSQWGHAQLLNEMRVGAWYSMHVDADPIFSSHPGDVWQTLLDRVEPRPYVDYRPFSRNAREIPEAAP